MNSRPSFWKLNRTIDVGYQVLTIYTALMNAFSFKRHYRYNPLIIFNAGTCDILYACLRLWENWQHGENTSMNSRLFDCFRLCFHCDSVPPSGGSERWKNRLGDTKKKPGTKNRTRRCWEREMMDLRWRGWDYFKDNRNSVTEELKLSLQ